MIDEYNEKTDDLEISCSPNAILLFSACVNTVEGWCNRLQADRRTKIWSISPAHNVRSGLPPMIEFHGTDAEQVPNYKNPEPNLFAYLTEAVTKQIPGNFPV
jgi:hypothetical protein